LWLEYAESVGEAVRHRRKFGKLEDLAPNIVFNPKTETCVQTVTGFGNPLFFGFR
jgi:hypothetical protein